MGAHFAEGKTMEDSRPDYRLLDYLNESGLMSDGCYQRAIRYTERPVVKGYQLLPLGSEIPGRKRGESRADHDLQREERHRRRGKQIRHHRT